MVAGLLIAGPSVAPAFAKRPRKTDALEREELREEQVDQKSEKEAIREEQEEQKEKHTAEKTERVRHAHHHAADGDDGDLD